MKYTLVLLVCLLLLNCERNNNDKISENEGYIVGFDPCAYQHHYKIGYAIITSDLKDTLMTYNLSDSIYSFPPEYFYNYFNTGYFPSTARYEFKIYFSYTVAEENEKVYNLCTTDINMADFKNAVQVIIKSVSKE